MMGNCKSYVKSMDGNWRVWCYVKENINGNQQTTCSDIQMSRRYPGELWSRHACVTPSLDSWECSECKKRLQPQVANDDFYDDI